MTSSRFSIRDASRHDLRPQGGPLAADVVGTPGDDDLSGGPEDDSIDGLAGADTLSGGNGDDSLFGRSGNDRLSGDAAEDRLSGGNDKDRLFGGDGEDEIHGGRGSDVIVGGLGNDELIGGDGRDVFRYDDLREARFLGEGFEEEIIDLSSKDWIDVSRIDADPTTAGDQAFVFVARFTGTIGELVTNFDEEEGETYIKVDIDGDANGDMLIELEGDYRDFVNFIL